MRIILPDECLDKYPIVGVRSGSESNPDLHLKSRGPVLLNDHALSNCKSSLRSVNGGTNWAHSGTHLKAELSGTGRQKDVNKHLSRPSTSAWPGP